MPLTKKKSEKTIVRSSKLLFLSAIVLLLASCLNWILETPSFTIRGAILQPVSLTEMNLLLELDVENTNRFDLKLKSFHYIVYLYNEEIGRGSMENDILIPSSATTRLKMPIAVKLKSISGILKTILTNDDIPYKIEGQADVAAVFGSSNFSFFSDGRIKLKN